jgi:hypothetical protein
MPETTSLSADDIEVSRIALDDVGFYVGDRDPSDPLVAVNNRTNGDLMY